MPELIDTYIGATGIVEKSYLDHDGKLYVDAKQDIEKDIEFSTALRNADEYSSQGIKRGWMHVAHIPDILCRALKQRGIDVMTAPVKDIMAGICALHIEKVLTTRKRVG